MINPSKSKDIRFWRKWHASGAVAKPQYAENALVIDAIGEHFAGPAKGCQTLSLGRNPFLSGMGWSPLCAVVVPTSPKYKVGVILSRVPGHAVPIDVFFPSTTAN